MSFPPADVLILAVSHFKFLTQALVTQVYKHKRGSQRPSRTLREQFSNPDIT